MSRAGKSKSCASKSKHQRGYTLLLSLITLLGVGSAWIAGITVHTTTSRTDQSADQTLALSQARAALISYAVNYIDHYGAQGAGVGHLPCPDTDKPDEPDSPLADTWHRDGPNPPCAKQAVEHGWLPRHVNVRDGRFHFHTRSRQRLLYAVSGQFVNNPVGRIVNPSTDSGFRVGHYTDVIAVLATPPLDEDLADDKFWLSQNLIANQGTAFSLIRMADLHKASMQRVGGWLVSHLNNAMEQRCAPNNETNQCGLIDRYLLQCDTERKLILLHWLNTELAPIDCENQEHFLQSTFTLLENVPIQRHWFMRNKWFEFVELSFDQDCFMVTGLGCRFTLLPIDDDMEILKIGLQPLSDPVEP